MIKPVHNINVIEQRINELPLWKKTAFKVAALAPLLFISAAMWTVGFAHGGMIGAGFGDGIGTLIGSAVSIIIQAIIIKCLFTNVASKDLKDYVKFELKKSVTNSLAAIPAGFMFNVAIFKHASSLLRAFGIGAIVAGTTFSSLTILSGINSVIEMIRKHTNEEEIEKIKKKFKIDLINNIWSCLFTVIFMEAGFCATDFKIFGDGGLIVSSPLRTGLSNLLGGLIDGVINIIKQPTSKIFTANFIQVSTSYIENCCNEDNNNDLFPEMSLTRYWG